PEAGAGSSAALLQCSREIRLRALERGDETENDAGRKRDKQRKRDDAPIEADERAVLADARQSGGVDLQKTADPHPSEEESEDTAGEREHDALGQHLTDDARPRSADRCAARHSTPAPGTPDASQTDHG